MSVALFLFVRGARFTALADFRFIIVFAESPSVLPPARHDSPPYPSIRHCVMLTWREKRRGMTGGGNLTNTTLKYYITVECEIVLVF